MPPPSEDQGKKNITIYTRIAAIQERYGRSPTSYELRALQELPLELAKDLWDRTPTGRKIYQLLLDSKNGTDVSYLEEAGRLLWEQMNHNPSDMSNPVGSMSSYLEKLEKQSSLLDQSYQSSAVTDDPFAKAVKRQIGNDSVGMENQEASGAGSRDNFTSNESNTASYPDSLINPPRHLMYSPSPSQGGRANPNSQVDSNSRNSTAHSQFSTSQSGENSSDQHNSILNNVQYHSVKPSSKWFHTPIDIEQAPLYPFQSPNVGQLGSDYYTNQHGLELENTYQMPVIPYINQNYGIGSGKYPSSPVPSTVSRPPHKYTSPYKDRSQRPAETRDFSTLPDDSNHHQPSSEAFNNQWDSNFGFNHLHAPQSVYVDPGEHLYFAHGYPKHVSGKQPHPDAYSQQMASQGAPFSGYVPPDHQHPRHQMPAAPYSYPFETSDRGAAFSGYPTGYQIPPPQISVTSYGNPYPQQRNPYGTIAFPPYYQGPAEMSQYNTIQQQAEQLNHPFPSPVPRSMQMKPTSNAGELGVMTTKEPFYDPSHGMKVLNSPYPTPQPKTPMVQTQDPVTPLANNQPSTAGGHLGDLDYEAIRHYFQDDIKEPEIPQAIPSPSPSIKAATATTSAPELQALKPRTKSFVNQTPIAANTGPAPLTKRIKLTKSDSWFTVSADYSGPEYTHPTTTKETTPASKNEATKDVDSIVSSPKLDASNPPFAHHVIDVAELASSIYQRTKSTEEGQATTEVNESNLVSVPAGQGAVIQADGHKSSQSSEKKRKAKEAEMEGQGENVVKEDVKKRLRPRRSKD